MSSQYRQDCIRIALPKGRLYTDTANFLTAARLGLRNYKDETRLYRFQSTKFSYLSAKMFQERDIPIQVAIGNYDLGICGLDWVEELLAKYPASALIKVINLGYGNGSLFVATSQYEGIASVGELLNRQDNWQIVSEYPNLAEAFALSLRLRRFRIFPVWGAAEVYPPENADFIVVWGRDEQELRANKLQPLKRLLATSAVLIANRESWKTKNMSDILACLSSVDSGVLEPPLLTKAANVPTIPLPQEKDSISLALPDGHQQPPTAQLLNKAGLRATGYSSEILNRRPTFDLSWIRAKVIRPQDMPLQVANGNFDLAITGKDWLLDHLYRFPSSPVVELVSFGFGTVRIVAVVSQELPVDNVADLKRLMKSGGLSSLKVVSEYVNIADKYLRDNHISPYRVIPTWGASEAFLPEDADLLIENTQTGETLARHNLKIIEVLFISTACLIGNKISSGSSIKRERINSLIEILRQVATG